MSALHAGDTTLFLAGDVMLGRGIDQILPHPSEPELREEYVDNALGYVELAERVHGSVPSRITPAYIWGDGLAVLAAEKPHASIVNLETSVTRSAEFWPRKAVHYRMHPENVAGLTAARIDVCSVANNHVLDFGVSGLLETLATLARAGLRCVGAGRDLEQACRPVRVACADGSWLSVLAAGCPSSGIPSAWAAGAARPGVYLLDELSEAAADSVAARLSAHAAPEDVLVVSIHWGSNWGYEIDADQILFAHRLIDRGVDIVHGHSSHHVRSLELYRGRLILYGAGDLITDYEGIGVSPPYRGDIGAMYFASLARDGALSALRIVPFSMKRLRLTRCPAPDAEWLLGTLNRLGRDKGTRFAFARDGVIVLDV